MSDIPGARDDLLQIAEILGATDPDRAAEIRRIVHDKLFRRSAARRMQRSSRRVTSDLKNEIIELAETTDLHSAEIAVQVGVNPGRVSEILQGDR